LIDLQTRFNRKGHELTMKKLGLVLMLLAMVAVPMLACGFPLPAGTGTMAVAKTICADGEDPATCQARQDAFQMMSTIQSAAVPDWSMSMLVETNDPTQDTNVTIKGSIEYVVVPSDEGLGANIHAVIEEGSSVSAEGTDTITGAELIIIGNTLYAREAGDETWTSQTMTPDEFSSFGLILGLAGTTGTGIDFYTDPATFSVTAEPDAEFEGQTMKVQNLDVDLAGFASSDALGGLMEQGAEASGGLTDSFEEGAGMSMQDLGMMLPLVFMMATEADAGTVLHIGADDGYIHYVEDFFVLNIDLPAFEEGAEATKLNFRYSISGHINQINEAITIEAPTNVIEGEVPDLFGGANLGDSLFGGME
jgi:hypothetical protein